MFLADAVVETPTGVGRTHREAARACEAQLGDARDQRRGPRRGDRGRSLDGRALATFVAKATALASTTVSDPSERQREH